MRLRQAWSNGSIWTTSFSNGRFLNWHNVVNFQRHFRGVPSAEFTLLVGSNCDHEVVLKAKGLPSSGHKRQLNTVPDIVYLVRRKLAAYSKVCKFPKTIEAVAFTRPDSKLIGGRGKAVYSFLAQCPPDLVEQNLQVEAKLRR